MWQKSTQAQISITQIRVVREEEEVEGRRKRSEGVEVPP